MTFKNHRPAVNTFKLVITFFTILICFCNGDHGNAFQATSPYCMDENGNFVDFYIVYKLPQSLRYFVIFPGAPSPVLSNEDANAQTSVFGRTLEQIFQPIAPPTFSYITWNDGEASGAIDEDQDEVANKTEALIDKNASHGHSKGVLAFSAEGGFLLIHTIPGFANVVSSWFPSNGRTNAQIAVCLSLSGAEFSDKLHSILDGMRTFKPYIRNKIFRDNEDEDIVFKILRIGDRLSIPPEPEVWATQLEINFRLHFFGRHKAKPEATDMTFDAFATLADHYRTRFIAQTWPTGGWGSNCELPYSVEKVLQIIIRPGPDQPIWPYTQDHSKWAVATDSSHVCIGDLNRHPTTMSRGGMFLCLQDNTIRNMFLYFVLTHEQCPGLLENSD